MNQIPNVEELIEDFKEATKPCGMECTEKEIILRQINAKINTILAQKDAEVQKARHDWLRDEIVRLEGTYIVSGKGVEFINPHIKTWEQGYNHAVSEIIDRYHSELDQPTV